MDIVCKVIFGWFCLMFILHFSDMFSGNSKKREVTVDVMVKLIIPAIIVLSYLLFVK